MSVNAVRKQSSEEEVQTLAKSLIKSWKKLLGMSATGLPRTAVLSDLQVCLVPLSCLTCRSASYRCLV